SRSGRPMTRRELEAMTARRGEAAGVPDCRPHRARHSYNTALLRAGVDLRVIQQLLGHEDIKSTVIYTEVANPVTAAAVLRLPWYAKPPGKYPALQRGVLYYPRGPPGYACRLAQDKIGARGRL